MAFPTVLVWVWPETEFTTDESNEESSMKGLQRRGRQVHKTNALRHPETGNKGWLLLQLGLKGQRKHELIPLPLGTMDGALLRGATVMREAPTARDVAPVQAGNREEIL